MSRKIDSKMMKRAVELAFNYELNRNSKVSSHSQLERWVIKTLNDMYQPKDTAYALKLVMDDLFGIDFDTEGNELADKDQVVNDRYSEYDFALEHTGGNCTAYVSRRVNMQLWVTELDGCNVPETLGDKVSLGVYDGEGDGVMGVKHFENTSQMMESDWFQWLIKFE